jgi:hypothetical protein
MVGAILRALSTLPIEAYNEAVPKKVQFWITFAGQVKAHCNIPQSAQY